MSQTKKILLTGVTGQDGSSVVVNIPTVGRVPRGATVEKLVVPR